MKHLVVVGNGMAGVASVEHLLVHAPRLPDLQHLTLMPAVASLQPALPDERCNVAAPETLVRRIRSEFEEMPGLSLTPAQATRLFGISPEECSRVLQRLVDDGFVCLKSHGRYALRVEPA